MRGAAQSMLLAQLEDVRNQSESARSAREATLEQLDAECALRKAEANLEQNPQKRQQVENDIDEMVKARCGTQWFIC